MYARAFRLPSLTVEHPAERLVRFALLLAVALMITSYVYLIGASTFNIIARKQAEAESFATQSRLAQINTEYYALSRQVTPTNASLFGLLPIEQKSYVVRATQLGFAGGSAQ